jgi:hypothetical protein
MITLGLCSIDCSSKCGDDLLGLLGPEDSCPGDNNIASCVDDEYLIIHPQKTGSVKILASISTSINGFWANTPVNLDILVRESFAKFRHLGNTSF